MDFDYYSNYINRDEHVDWFCIDGGTQLVPEAMNASLKSPLKKEHLEKRVTKIAIDRTDTGLSPMRVEVDGETEVRKYTTVFATPTLACLQRIDLTELELLYEQKDALRSLHYDTASKVGMKFKTPWVSINAFNIFCIIIAIGKNCMNFVHFPLLLLPSLLCQNLLHIGRSFLTVGIQWIELGIKGGLGKTDMPLRTW